MIYKFKPGQTYRMLTTDSRQFEDACGIWTFIREDGDDFVFHFTFDGSDEYYPIDEDRTLNILDVQSLVECDFDDINE